MHEKKLPALLSTMEDIHRRFTDHINAWTAGTIEGALGFHDHVEGLQLLDRIGRDYMRMSISLFQNQTVEDVEHTQELWEPSTESRTKAS